MRWNLRVLRLKNLLQYEPRKTSSTWILQHIMLANLKYTNKPGFGQIAVMNYEEKDSMTGDFRRSPKKHHMKPLRFCIRGKMFFRLAVMYVHAQAFVTWLKCNIPSKNWPFHMQVAKSMRMFLRDEISRFAIFDTPGLDFPGMSLWPPGILLGHTLLGQPCG